MMLGYTSRLSRRHWRFKPSRLKQIVTQEPNEMDAIEPSEPVSPLQRAVASTPDKTALIEARSGRTWTFAQLNDASIRCARLFAHQGLGFGDHIAVMTENLAENLIVTSAARRSGLYLTPINWHLSADEAEYVIRDCAAKWLLVSPGVGEVLHTLSASLPAEVNLWTTGEATGRFESLSVGMAECSSAPLDEELDGAYMFYSSGTTGKPKGIFRPIERQLAGSQPDYLAQLLEAMWGWSSDTVYLCPAPLYHAAPLAWSMMTIEMGAAVVLMDKFDALESLSLIERYQINRIQVVPTMFVRILKLTREEREAHDLSSLECVVHAAAPCPVEVKQQMLDWWGPIIHEYYAGSEGGGMVAVGPEDWLAHPGTVGRPLLGSLHILDDEGQEVSVGQVGTVYFDGGADFAYHGDEKKTQDAYNGQGWHTLGDMGYVDEEGYLYLTDRKSHMIISGGVNIYPQEAENVLTMHPKVVDVAVIGVPHSEYGEEVKAVVQLAEGAQGDAALADELIGYCQARLTKYKCPRSVDFVSELPRLASGKLLKRQLRDRYWSEREGETSDSQARRI